MILSPDHISFIHSHWPEMPNPAIAQSIGLTPHQLRTYLYSKGMYKLRLEYWTDEQVDFLRENFQLIGDKELAEIFEAKWPKQKTWTLKHIEKKRNYLGLKRTKEETFAIHHRNIANGSWKDAGAKIWAKRGEMPEGTIRYWGKGNRKVPYIKVDGAFIHWARHRYEQLHGPIPEGMNCVFADNNPRNRSDHNLILVSNADLGRRNGLTSVVSLSDNYIAGMMTYGNKELRTEILEHHPKLIEIKRLQLQLNRTIHEKL